MVTIPEVLRGVMKERGYRSIEIMALQETIRIGTPVSPAALRSWMTANARYRRRPLSARSLRTLSQISGRSMDELLEAAEADSRPSALAS